MRRVNLVRALTRPVQNDIAISFTLEISQPGKFSSLSQHVK